MAHLCGACIGARAVVGRASLPWSWCWCHEEHVGNCYPPMASHLQTFCLHYQSPKKTKWEFLKMGKSMKTPKLSVSLLKMTHHLDLKHGAPRDPLAPQIHLRHRIRKNSPALLRRWHPCCVSHVLSMLPMLAVKTTQIRGIHLNMGPSESSESSALIHVSYFSLISLKIVLEINTNT